MAQELDSSQSVPGPVFLGQLQNVGNAGDNKKRNLIFGLPICFCLAAAIGLCLGALVHKQFTSLPWILFMCFPVLLLSGLPNHSQKEAHSNKQVALTVDRLLERTRRGSFGRLPLKKGKIVWLTQEGLYTYHKRFLPWEMFRMFFLEEGMLADGLKPIHRINLQPKEPRTISRKKAYLSHGLLFLPTLIGGLPLFRLVSHLGLRDDVLALFFMTGAFLLLFVYMLTRYAYETRPERCRLTVLIDQQQTHASALLEFLGEYIPV